MKNKWTGIIIVAIVLVAMIIIGGYFLNREKGPEKKRILDWTPNYTYDDNKDPYDVDVMRAVISSAVGETNFHTLADTGTLENVLPEGRGNNYIFIGKNYALSLNETNVLQEFLERGNNVFLLTQGVNTEAFEFLFAEEDASGDWYYYRGINSAYNPIKGQLDSFTLGPIGNYDSSVVVHWERFLLDKYKVVFFLDSNELDYDEGFPYFLSDWENLQLIDNSMPCFARKRVGQGYVYIHTVPMVFTNVHMKQEPFFHHLNGLLSYMDNPVVFWDNHKRQDYQEKFPDSQHESEFKYIVSQPELKYALYLALIGIILYVLFAMKRTQRPIPVPDKNRNLSIQSLQMVSRLYALYPDHRQISMTRMTVFMHFISSRYGLIINELDEDFYDKLSNVSGVRRDLVRSIFINHQRIGNQKKISESDAVNFSDKINRFYQGCK